MLGPRGSEKENRPVGAFGRQHDGGLDVVHVGAEQHEVGRLRPAQFVEPRDLGGEVPGGNSGVEHFHTSRGTAPENLEERVFLLDTLAERERIADPQDAREGVARVGIAPAQPGRGGPHRRAMHFLAGNDASVHLRTIVKG